jgi:hypothetical protein
MGVVMGATECINCDWFELHVYVHMVFCMGVPYFSYPL